MDYTDLKITDLITEHRKLTFLVGAGCSIAPPSCLPAASAIINALINYTCVNTEVDEILGLGELRFEQLIEIIRDQLDPDLKIIDFYGLCDQPNIQHFFLAEMMKKGNFVLTTNFDFLIEHALLQSGVAKENVIPVITREDFQKYSEPNEAYKEGKKVLYKVHGSTENILKPVDQRDTRDSLIATIQAFGSNKEGKNVFQLEAFKQPAFENLTANRSLVIMGYSGSDDFDIVPTLKILKNVQDIIWINHVQEDGDKEVIYQIEMEEIDKYENLAKVDQILFDIKRSNYAKRIFRIDVNTTRLVNKLIPTHPKIKKKKPFSIDFNEWLSINIRAPSQLEKITIPTRIYLDFNLYDQAMDTLKLTDVLVKYIYRAESQQWKNKFLATTHLFRGEILEAQGSYSEALEQFEKVNQLGGHQGLLEAKFRVFFNIGKIYLKQGNYQEAMVQQERALQIALQTNNHYELATSFNGIGAIYQSQGNYSEALKQYEVSLQIAEELGNLNLKANILNNIGMLYEAKDSYPEAKKHLEEAFKISEQLGDLIRKATALKNLGKILKAQKNYPEAIKRHEDAIQVAEQIGDLNVKASNLANIGHIYNDQKKYSQALALYNKAIEIMKKLGDLRNTAFILNDIGGIHLKKKDKDLAFVNFNKSLGIGEQLKDSHVKANSLSWIGLYYGLLKDKSNALDYFEKVLAIYEDLGMKNEVQAIHANISDIKIILG